GTVILLGGEPHHIDANPDHVPCAQISQLFIQLGTADDIREHYREFDFFAHVTPFYLIRSRGLKPFTLQSLGSVSEAPNTEFQAPHPGVRQPRTETGARRARPRVRPSSHACAG